ncbi:MAG: GC-type dockerin domain-anchored protein [Phycisphaerales bacterium]
MPGHARIAFILTLASSAGVAHAQATIDWTTTFELSVASTLFDAVTASDGTTFVASTINFSSINLTRLDADGSVAWTQMFGVSAQDEARALALSDDESSVYLLASSSRPVSSADYAVVKYDAATGLQTWVIYLDGGDQGIDRPTDIAATPDGGCVVTGGMDTPNEQRDFGTARLDAAGNLLWTSYFTGFGPFLFENDDAEFVAVDASGDVVVTGNAMSGSDSDIVTVKYDGATGNEIWQSSYAGFNNDAAEGLGFLPNGDVVVLGIDSLTSGPRWVLACYDGSTGAERWSTIYARGVSQRARHLAVGADGTVYATGLFDPTTTISGDAQLSVIAVDGSSGALIWEQDFGDPGTGNGEEGNRVYPDSAGSVWVIGSTSSDSIVGDPLEEDGLLLRLDQATGVIESATLLDTSNGTQINREALRHAGVDAAGRIYAVGKLEGATLANIAVRFTLTDCTADTNGDGKLSPSDFNAWVSAFNAGASACDQNDDGLCSPDDFTAWLNNYNAGC